MYKNKKILAIIPARGGSKGLKGKNIRLLAGKHLIGWTIEQALASKYLDKVIVNTDDSEISRISGSYGAEIPFMRPKRLAADNSRVLDTVLHTLDFFKKRGLTFDYMVLLEPTSPLRKKGDIDSAIKRLLDCDGRAESIISVGEIVLEHPDYAKIIDATGYVQPYGEEKKTVSIRQQLPLVYFPYGVIYMAKVSEIIKHKSVFPGRILPFFIERWQNYEVNDIWDLVCIEAILNTQRRKK